MTPHQAEPFPNRCRQSTPCRLQNGGFVKVDIRSVFAFKLCFIQKPFCSACTGQGGKGRAGIPQSPQDKTAADERHKAAKEVFPANVAESREAFFRPTKAQERLKRQGFGLFDFSQVSSKVISQQKQFAKKSNRSSVSAQFRGSPQFNTKF